MTADDVVVEDGAVRVRRMTGTDLEFGLLVRWLNQRHVREWWNPDGPEADGDLVRRDYGPYTMPESQGVGAIIEDRGTPVGFVQFYPWSIEAEYCAKVGISLEEGAWAFDVFIGEPEAIGTGVATRALDLLCAYLFRERGASAVVIVTETGNLRAHHVYEKIGFRKTGEFLDDDTRGGHRVRSYLMRRPAF